MGQCHSKRIHQPSASQQKFSIANFIPAFLIAILPKCPFCIMAYTGAVSLCSGKMWSPNTNAYSSYLIMGLSVLVLLAILLNHRGKRTYLAAIFAVAGIALLYLSQYYWLSEFTYYVSVILLFFSIWFNGSFFYFIKRNQNKKAKPVSSNSDYKNKPIINESW